MYITVSVPLYGGVVIFNSNSYLNEEEAGFPRQVWGNDIEGRTVREGRANTANQQAYRGNGIEGRTGYWRVGRVGVKFKSNQYCATEEAEVA